MPTADVPAAAPQNPASARTAVAVSPIAMGRSSNIFSFLRTEQNQVYANDSLNMVAFVHRQDVTIFGGGSGNAGRLRYDISTDGGQNFNLEVGELNPNYLLAPRYPQITGLNPANALNPFFANLVYTGSTLSGILAGVSEVSVAQNPVTTENYVSTSNSGVPGGLCPGLPGEFWMAEQLIDTASNLRDTVRILKGTYNTTSQDVDWVVHANIVPNWNTSFNGQIQAIGPNISFSPDGQTGWVALLGDLVGGPDTTFSPIFIRSTDAGQTWGAPVEVDLSTNPWLADSLRTLWLDSTNLPASSGEYTCAFDFDLTVDSAGNPHLAVVVGSRSTAANPNPGYGIMSGLSKFLVDVTSANGGTTFFAREVAPVLTFRTPSIGTTTTVTMDNHPQISRSADGNYIFYTWVDSDTSQFTGSMNGIGFGEFSNLAPNLRYSGYRVSDGFITCYRALTDGDLVWEGRILFPTMAPEVLSSPSGGGTCFQLPVVFAELLQQTITDPIQYHYLGNDAAFSSADFQNPTAVDLSWGQTCTLNFTACSGSTSQNTISGQIWNDTNGNGLQDPGEPPYALGVVMAMPGPWFASTNAAGNYSLSVPTGNFTVSMAPPLYYSQTFPANNNSHLVNFPGVGGTAPGQDFGIQGIPNQADLQVVIASSPMRPGFSRTHYLTLQNVGTTTESGTVTYTYDTLLNYLSSNLSGVHNATNSTATWNFANLDPGQFINYNVTMDVPSYAMIGDTVTVNAAVSLPPNELTPANNVDSIDIPILNSWDPNDKLVIPLGDGPGGSIANGTKLTYTVRFQNTGNAPAINVRIEDTLDTDLDPSTFVMLGSSHPYNWSMSGAGHLTWDFPNINLPDSNSNEPASHGFVQFQIDPYPNLSQGTRLENNAAIYFDFNPPIITNTVLNTIDFVIGAGDPGENALVAYPNPFTDEIHFVWREMGEGPFAVELIELSGRVLRRYERLTDERFTFSAADLVSGIYFYRFSDENGTRATGKIIRR
ncbi:MAG: T9SS type A sorting domain-containing protein [Bacteroidota bacterium]